MPGTLLIRADASVAIGTGHVMRCLALAQAWQGAGGNVAFAMQSCAPAIEARLSAENADIRRVTAPPGSSADAMQVLELIENHKPEWVVVDGYHFGRAYTQTLKQPGCKLLVIDDAGQGIDHSCDMVLNPNSYAHPGQYRPSESGPRLLLGARYILLRREFLRWQVWRREIPASARKVLVTMGGSDPENVTAKVIQALRLISDRRTEAVVVVGGSNPHASQLEELAAATIGLQLVKDPGDISELMSWADVAVSAAGTTCWEMCFLGLPAIIIVVAANQRAIARELPQRGAAIYLGNSAKVGARSIADQLRVVLDSPELRGRISQCARELVDGRGAERVVSALCAHDLRLRPARIGDCRLLWEWANDPVVRTGSFSQCDIPWTEHQLWFAEKLGNPDCSIWIGEDAERSPVGQVRIELANGEAEIHVSVARSHRGRGFAARLIELAVRETFDNTVATRVHALVRTENAASIRAFESAAFHNVGQESCKGCAAVHYVRSKDFHSAVSEFEANFCSPLDSAVTQ